MSWNSIEMAGKFLTRANAIHPEDEYTDELKVARQAAQDLYYECYMNSFDRAQVIKFLEEAIGGKLKVPDELPGSVDESVYTEAFIREAETIKSQLEKNKV